jgi:transmembrane sensor
LHSGEAHFQVAKDEARPFVVAAGHVAVRAVGTAFSVDRSSDRIDVLVTEGVVAVAKPQRENASPPPSENTGPATASGLSSAVLDPGPTEWRLGAGNRMVLDDAVNSTAPELRPVAATELNERFAWRSPRVEFSRASLLEVVKVMNQYSRTQFEIADRDLEQVRLSGRFRADDADAFARALEVSFGIRAERASETDIVLRRAG